MTLERRGEGDCLSDFIVDRRLAGELSTAETHAFDTHVASCARCRERFEEREKAKADFPTELPFVVDERVKTIAAGSALAERRPTRTARRLAAMTWGVPAATVVAMAAAVALFLRDRSTSELVGSTERSKGRPSISYYVKHGDVVRAGVEGDTLVPGDAIEFAYTSNAPRYLAVFSVDGAGHASVYYADGGRAARVEPGVNVPLPQSTVLDDVLGAENIYALLCEAPIRTEPIRSALEEGRLDSLEVPGCTLDHHAFSKVRP